MAEDDLLLFYLFLVLGLNYFFSVVLLSKSCIDFFHMQIQILVISDQKVQFFVNRNTYFSWVKYKYLGKKNRTGAKIRKRKKKSKGKWTNWLFKHLNFTDRFIIAIKLKESSSSASLRERVQRITKLQKPLIKEKLFVQIFLAGTNENLREVLPHYDCMGNKFPYVITM